ncbi:MAG: ABC transporter ATP-binding protein [Alphaproteobacteria bacterium]
MSESGPIMVALDGVRLTLSGPAGPVNILRGVDLKVRSGERLGVVGPSGSGKSTLLMVMAGLERPSAGAIHVAGRALAGLGEDTLAVLRRESIGIVFQAFHLIPTMTALENVAVPLELAGRPDAFDIARAALRSVGLDERKDHYPAQLSGGEQQRVALARAFAPEPQLLLADEPTGNLDRDTGREVMDLLFSLQGRRGTTLVAVTHDPSIVSRCDRVVRMVDGRIEDGVAAGAARVGGIRA